MSIQNEIEEYAEAALPKDPIAWCKHYKEPKIIHDALWGTFRLEAHEVALIDTPLIQRLRFIRQTGATYLTYPSALHTRFEHTLGVLYQASRICSALRDRNEQHRFDAGTTTAARFAALVHDTGHGPFSHTSEQYFASLEDMATLKNDNLRFRESGAGEILSCLILESKAFRGFVRAINDRFRLTINCDHIGKMITGSVDNDHMYQSEIVHGPLDADKLDYMHRDGMFSGLKMHVDLDRLYNSIEVLSGEVDGLYMTRLAGATAGVSPLSQIMFNKMLLNTGIYHHHKVRSVDCMLWAIFDLAYKRGATVGGKKLTSPVSFLQLSDDLVLVPELTDDPDIREVIERIRWRDLWKRAIVISRQTVPDDMHDQAQPDENKGLFSDFVLLGGNRRDKILKRREISDAIWEEAKRPCKQHEVWLDIPKLPSMDEAERTWIASPGGGPPLTLGEYLPIAQWVELYGTHQWRSHVFCPSSARQSINEATKIVLEREFGLLVTEKATQYAQIDGDE